MITKEITTILISSKTNLKKFFIFCYKMNYPVAELRGIIKVVNYFEKPMVSQTLPCKEYPRAELRGIL